MPTVNVTVAVELVEVPNGPADLDDGGTLYRIVSVTPSGGTAIRLRPHRPLPHALRRQLAAAAAGGVP